MGIFSQVIDAIEDRDIREHIDQHIDDNYVYGGDWESEMEHANIYLNSLIIKMAGRKRNRFERELTAARSVLKTVTDERDISLWIRDLKKVYFPALERVWH